MIDFILNKANNKNRNKKNFNFFLNPHSYYNLWKDRIFFESIKKTNNIFIDGVGLLIILKIYNFFLNRKKNIRRVTGLDYLNSVLLNKYNKKILILASKEINKKIKKKILVDNITHTVITVDLPLISQITKKNISYIFSRIKNYKKIDYCFVGIGAPKQEKLIYYLINNFPNKKKIRIDNFSGVGAALNYFTKYNSIVFKFMRRIYLEWLYRLCIEPKRMWNRTFISFPMFLIFSIFRDKPKYYSFKISNNLNKYLSQSRGFIFAAFNLAFFSYLFKNKIKINKYFILWPDGIFSKFFLNIKKLPGRTLIKKLKIKKNIKNIHILGKFSHIDRVFIEKQYSIPIKHTDLPFGSTELILKSLPKISKKELIILTLPTPKQEIIADALIKRNKNYKIICIGGGLGIASKDEKPCPLTWEKLNLEWLWRLRYQTRRRILRLIETFINSFFSLIFIFNKRIELIK